jgi:hypothetical protein
MREEIPIDTARVDRRSPLWCPLVFAVMAHDKPYLGFGEKTDGASWCHVVPFPADRISSFRSSHFVPRSVFEGVEPGHFNVKLAENSGWFLQTQASNPLWVEREPLTFTKCLNALDASGAPRLRDGKFVLLSNNMSVITPMSDLGDLVWSRDYLELADAVSPYLPQNALSRFATHPEYAKSLKEFGLDNVRRLFAYVDHTRLHTIADTIGRLIIAFDREAALQRSLPRFALRLPDDEDFGKEVRDADQGFADPVGPSLAPMGPRAALEVLARRTDEEYAECRSTINHAIDRVREVERNNREGDAGNYPASYLRDMTGPNGERITALHLRRFVPGTSFQVFPAEDTRPWGSHPTR